jgi:threonine aldolase
MLSGDLWSRCAGHANAMAELLAASVSTLPDVTVTQSVDANEVFALLPPEWIGPLRERYPFYVWNETRGEVRWVTSWDTAVEDVEGFAAMLRAMADNGTVEARADA